MPVPWSIWRRVKSRTCFLTWILCKVSSFCLFDVYVWCFLAFQLLLFLYIPFPLKEVMFLPKKKDVMYLFTSGETWIDNFDYIPAPRFCIQGVMNHHPLRVPFGRHCFCWKVLIYPPLSELEISATSCHFSYHEQLTRIYVQSILPIHLVSRPL